ncbi:MAG: fibrobacter succinogenes major paralogous domain-containing protein [Lacibacter sp.]|jgi:uncharacterized protein (TIGR02145 family)
MIGITEHKAAAGHTYTSIAGFHTKHIIGQDTVIYDLDSNRYTVVQIGKQYWLRENLRTTRYNDTTPIATGLTDRQWSETQSGAYAVYENNPAYEARYGKLYNGYAARSGKLCPKGWRIPTDKDWNELESFLGIPAAELGRTGIRGEKGALLKGGNSWQPSEYPVTNETSFTALPAGVRKKNGEYVTEGQYANFWTTTVYDDRYGLYLWNRHLNFNSNGIGRIYTSANDGYSCRCIKATEPESAPKTVKKPASTNTTKPKQ